MTAPRQTVLPSVGKATPAGPSSPTAPSSGPGASAGITFVNHNVIPAQGRGGGRRLSSRGSAGQPQPVHPTPPLTSSSSGMQRRAPLGSTVPSTKVGVGPMRTGSIITFGSPVPPLYTTSSADSSGCAAGIVLDGSRATSKVDGPFSIEGVRTGEEVRVGDVERRQPPARRAPSITRATAGDSAGGGADTAHAERRVKALQADVRNLTEKLKKSRAAKQAAAEQAALTLEELERRLELQTSFLREQRERPAWEMANALAKTACSTLSSSRTLFKKEVEALQSRVTEFRSALDAEQQRHVAALQTQDAARQGEKDLALLKAETELAELRAAADEQAVRAAEEKQALERRVAEAEDKLRLALESSQALERKTSAVDYLAAQCRLFVRQVCQPAFHVVKGPSLEPVEKDRAEPTGFVLVPLVVLLHGYSLLPADDRKEVIDHYEAEAQALSS